MALDLGLARALRVARVMELALAEPDGWSVDLDGLRVPAILQVQDDRIIFETCTPEIDFSTQKAILYWGEDAQLIGAFDGGPGEVFAWTLRLPESVMA